MVQPQGQSWGSHVERQGGHLSERTTTILHIAAVLVLVTSVISGWYYGLATSEARPLLIVSLDWSAVAAIGLIFLSYQLPRRR